MRELDDATKTVEDVLKTPAILIVANFLLYLNRSGHTAQLIPVPSKS